MQPVLRENLIQSGFSHGLVNGLTVDKSVLCLWPKKRDLMVLQLFSLSIHWTRSTDLQWGFMGNMFRWRAKHSCRQRDNFSEQQTNVFLFIRAVQSFMCFFLLGLIVLHKISYLFKLISDFKMLWIWFVTIKHGSRILSDGEKHYYFHMFHICLFLNIQERHSDVGVHLKCFFPYLSRCQRFLNDVSLLFFGEQEETSAETSVTLLPKRSSWYIKMILLCVIYDPWSSMIHYAYIATDCLWQMSLWSKQLNRKTIWAVL